MKCTLCCIDVSLCYHDVSVSRDLKTANIFLTKNEMLKLGDFGISKIVATKGASTVLGTPYYISPEMVGTKHSYSNL